jgi:uncharacterized protein YodC (DUF2158 family)
MVANAHFTGTWQYLGAGAAWGIGNNFGGPTNGLTFAMAAVGAGGGTVTWTTPLTIANGGNVSINAPTSGAALVVTGVNTAGQPSVHFNTNDNTSNISLDITGSTNNACTVRFLNNAYSQVNYQMYADNTQAQVGTFVNTPLNIATNGTTRVQITAGGVTAVNLDAVGSYYEVGLRDLVFNNQSGASYTLVLTDRGKLVNATNAGPSNFTVPNAIFSAGNVVTILNNSSTAMTITQGASMTMYNCANSATGNRTLAGRGVATIVFTASNQCYISGAGLT